MISAIRSPAAPAVHGHHGDPVEPGRGAGASFASKTTIYWMCQRWLAVGRERALDHRHPLPGVRPREPAQGQFRPAVLLVKHQSTWETFAMPAIMPHPLAYVFKKELLRVPFFGWAIGSMDMIHIDRADGARAFAKMVQQGKRLLDQGTWVIMFPEGTRIERGQQGQYKSGGTRLAIKTGAR